MASSSERELLWYCVAVLSTDCRVAQKFKGFESFEAHKHREAGLWQSTTPTDSGTASASTHLITTRETGDRENERPMD